MITEGIEDAVRHAVEEAVFAGASGQSGDMPGNDPVEIRTNVILTLIRTEAINLADKIIGKDRIIRSETNLEEGTETMNPADKAVFDYQVQQRIELAEYQNPSKNILDPKDLINDNLSENEG